MCPVRLKLPTSFARGTNGADVRLYFGTTSKPVSILYKKKKLGIWKITCSNVFLFIYYFKLVQVRAWLPQELTSFTLLKL